MDRQINLLKPYVHFKGNVYVPFVIAVDTTTNEEVVTYMGLYEGNPMFVRPLKEFMSEIPKNATCGDLESFKYRFTEIHDYVKEIQATEKVMEKLFLGGIISDSRDECSDANKK